MVPIENRQYQGFYPGTTGKDMIRMRWEEPINDGCACQLPPYAKHPREMGYRTYRTDTDRHDVCPRHLHEGIMGPIIAGSPCEEEFRKLHTQKIS